MTKKAPELRFPEFSGEWEEKKLEEIAKIQRGASPRPITSKKWYNHKDKTVGWVRISDVNNRYLTKTENYFSEEGVKKSRFLPKDSVIMSICITIGKSAITEIDTCINDGLAGFSNLKGVNKEFLYYYLSILENKFISMGQIGSQANLNTNIVKKTKIKVPSLKEQEKIASFLSQVDNKIEKLEKKQNLLENYKKGIVQQIFSRKLRFKDETGKDYPDWQEKKLGNIVTFLDKKRKRLNKSQRSLMKGPYPYYGVSGIIDYVDDYIFHEELILLAEDGTNIVNRSSRLVFLAKGKYLVGNHAHVMRADSNINQYFLCEQLENMNFEKYNTGSAQPKLNLDACKGIIVKIPSLKEQTKIKNFLKILDQKIETIIKEIDINREFKKGLLQQMFPSYKKSKELKSKDYSKLDLREQTVLL